MKRSEAVNSLIQYVDRTISDWTINREHMGNLLYFIEKEIGMVPPSYIPPFKEGEEFVYYIKNEWEPEQVGSPTEVE